MKQRIGDIRSGASVLSGELDKNLDYYPEDAGSAWTVEIQTANGVRVQNEPTGKRAFVHKNTEVEIVTLSFQL